MQKFITFVVGMSLILSIMYSMEKEMNTDRLKCIEKGGSFIRISGEMHCVNKDVFINIQDKLYESNSQ